MGAQGEFFEKPDTIVLETSNDEAAPSEPSAPNPATPVVIASVEFTGSEASLSVRRTMKDLSIPKLYYSISEVSRLTALEPYVLRYWETEFDDLRPQKNRAGNRIYSNKDIKLILHIKELLREQRYTIEGAKAIFRSERFSDSHMAEEVAAMPDPAQIPLPAEKPPAPQAAFTLDELRDLKASLVALKALFQ